MAARKTTTKEKKEEKGRVINRMAITHPLITEKSTILGEHGKYIFLVKKESTKPEVKKAVEGIYNVEVEKVNVINTSSKKRRLGRTLGVRSGYRKAIVTLKKGHKLDILPH